MNCLVRSVICGWVFGVLFISALNAATSSTSSTPSTTTTTSTTTSTTKKSTSPASSTTLTPEEECASHSNSCDDCLKIAKCMYCYSNNTCLVYPTGKVLPTSVCALDKARWGVCWLNFEAMIISVGVIGGIIILTITCCCVYCCCCRKSGTKKYDREDAKFESQKMERKAKQDERRTERKSRLDEIRRKYGLVKDDAPYQRFDS